MSDGSEIEVFVTPTFEKALKRLTAKQVSRVDDEIERIIDDPEIGTQKRGDLSYLWVHKFKLAGQQVLLGYSREVERLTVYLLNLGPHENFYRDMKRRRDSDLKIIRQGPGHGKGTEGPSFGDDTELFVRGESGVEGVMAGKLFAESAVKQQAGGVLLSLHYPIRSRCGRPVRDV